MKPLVFSDQILPKSPRVLFMGTPDYAVPSLRALHTWCERQKGSIVGVVSQPDRPKGRGRKLIRTPVAATADELKLSCYQWPRLNQESYDTLSRLNYDIAIVIAYGKILPTRYLTLPKWGCINLHASLLPAYRGAAPIQWALINGECQTGVSVMRLDEGMDTGPVAHMLSMVIDPDATSAMLFEQLAALSAQALVEVLDRWVDPHSEQPVVFSDQPHEGVSYAPMLSKTDGVLNWSHSAVQLAHRIRGVTPWPGGQVQIAEGTLKVLNAQPWSESDVIEYLQEASLDDGPGSVIGLLAEGPLIRCSEGALLLTRVQRPSKKSTSGGDFYRGYPITVGALLSSC